MAENTNSAITDKRREKLCKVTSGKVTSIAKITHIAFGDGGVNAEKEVIAPSASQTALNHELGRYAVGGVTYPDTTTARYAVTIPKAELNGKFISEAALVDEDGDLCAIKNMLEKGKDENVEFVFTFDDKF